MGNKKSSVEWLITELGEYFPEGIGGIELMVQQASEMEVAGREMSYSDGYREGYKRALDYMTMFIKNAIETKDK